MSFHVTVAGSGTIWDSSDTQVNDLIVIKCYPRILFFIERKNRSDNVSANLLASIYSVVSK